MKKRKRKRGGIRRVLRYLYSVAEQMDGVFEEAEVHFVGAFGVACGFSP